MSRPSFKLELISAIPALRAFAISLCHNPGSADDLVQETLLKAWDKQASFTRGGNLRAWLFTILRNTHYSHLRKRRREVEDVDGHFTGSLSSAPAQLDSLQLKSFRAALACLPADQREAIILIGASGFSYDEAAAICGCAVGTIKSRVSRARHALMGAMGLSGRGDFGADAVTAGVMAMRLAA